MSAGGLPRRYVLPLFEIGVEKGELDRISADLGMIDHTLCESPDLRGFLTDPTIERKMKMGVIEKLFPDISTYTKNFLRVVIDKNRTEILKLTYRLFSDLLNEHRGVMPGELETAVQLDDSTFDELIRTLEKKFNKRLELERKVDPSLLGGARVRVGNVVIDGSVRGRMARLKEALAGE